MAVSLVAAPGCGGDDSGGGASNGSGGSGGSSSSSSSSASTGGGGPCVPWGTWEIKYMGGGESCAPMNDTLTLAPGDGGPVQVSFAGDDTMPMDTCSDPPTPGAYSATGTVSEDGCSVTIKTATSYCTSGEDQCSSRDLTLTISGDTATGSITTKECWCGVFDPDPVTASATATRQ